MAVAVCVECGESSPEGVQFCGRCGAFLDWDTATTAGTEPEPEPEPEPELEPTPEAVRPGEAPVRRQAVVAAQPRPADAGERPCPRCAAGNAPGRRFCRACGMSLAGVAAPARLSWWRRLWSRLTSRRAYDAGTRRKVRRGGGTRRTVLLLLVAALAVAAVVSVPTGLLGRADDAVRDRFTTSHRVPARVAGASSAALGAAPENLVDAKSNRYWAPSGAAAGSWVELTFTDPVRLLRVIVTPGVSSDAALFARQGRPHALRAVVLTAAGPRPAQTLTLRDQPGPQYFDVRVSDATGIRLTVTSTYGMPPARLCALAELEFDGRG